MSKRFTIIAAVVLAALAGSFYFYNSYLYGEGRNIADEKVEHTVAAQELASAFETDAAAANQKYLNKAIAVEGIVTALSDSSVTVGGSVFCTLNARRELHVDEAVTVKGRCIGYDEIFSEVKLDQCTITN